MSYRALYLAAAVSIALALVGCSRKSQSGDSRPAPLPVTVATAVQKPVPVQVTAIGNVVPTETVTVRSRVGGQLTAIDFKEGQDVEQGQTLFTIDRGPLEATVRQAEANLARDTVQLENARKDVARYAELVKQGFVAQQQYDQVRTAAAALEGTVRADRAALQNARIELGYATIRAPINGRTGALLVHLGDLIVANTTALVVVNRLRPIDVAFALPEQQLTDVRRYRDERTLTVDAVDATGRPLAHGDLSFMDNRVDPTTGTIQLKATFANDPVVLWPGQFVSVVLTLTTEPRAIVVPTAAVQTGQDGRYVFVVKPDSTVAVHAVSVQRAVGAETVVASGVAPGESVVTTGQLRLFPGAHVEVKSAVAAADDGQASRAAPDAARAGADGRDTGASDVR